MASLSLHEARLLHQNRRELPLATLEGPLPARILSSHHDLSQGVWGQRSTYWHKESRALDSATREAIQNSATATNNKSSTPNMSISVEEASRVGRHNISTGRSNVLHVAAASAASSSRPMGTLISPTRLRSNGIMGSDVGTAMTSLGQSSLLSGSAPDFESSNVSSSSTYKNRQGSTIGRGRGQGQFKVEDAEEFIPSHLKEQEGNFTGPQALGTDNFSLLNGFDSTTNDLLHSQIHDKDAVGTTKSGPLQNVFVNQSLPRSTSHTTSSKRLTNDAYPHDIWNTAYPNTGFGHTANQASTRRTSNLRPDVEAYQPFDYQNDFDSRDYRQGVSGHLHNRPIDRQALNNNDLTHTTNQYAIAANGNTFITNAMTAANGTYDYRGVSRANQTSLPSVVQSDTHNFGTREPNLNNAYRESSPAIQMKPTPFSQHESASTPYHQSSISAQYHDPQYGYIPELPSSMTHFHQQRSVDQAGHMHLHVPNESHGSRTLSNGVPRSALLEEFRIHYKSRKYELKDIFGYIVEFSGDQAGSRFIQNKLEQANSDEKDQIFSELQTDARQLMSDVFGNYVIQKMFEYGNQSQKKILASCMQGNVLKLSLQPFGCRCVQKAFEHVLTEQQGILIKELDGYVLSVVESQHGNHVVQKAIELIPGEHVQFIVDAHRGQVVRLSKHTYGCRIIQRMLEHCTLQARRPILDELRHAVPSLIGDQFGNYVVQCMIRTCSSADRYNVVACVQKELLFYSKHKFASNVVEKAIQYADIEQRDAMVRKLTGPDPTNGMQRPVSDLLKDQYGNYVIQTVLRTIQGSPRRALMEEVRNHLNMMGKVNRGKQFTAMEETLAGISAMHSPSSISTGPQTPRTPASTNSGDNDDPGVVKPMNGVLPQFSRGDSQRVMFPLGQFHV